MSVLARLLRSEELDSHFPLHVITGQIRRKNIYNVPLVVSLTGGLDLRLVDRLPLTARDLLHDQEEVHSAHAWESGAHLELDFFLGTGVALFACDLDCATAASLAC